MEGPRVKNGRRTPAKGNPVNSKDQGILAVKAMFLDNTIIDLDHKDLRSYLIRWICKNNRWI